MDYPDPPSPSSIHLWVQISLFPTGRLLPSPPLPCVTPLLSAPSFIPQKLQPGELLEAVWPSTPLLAVFKLLSFHCLNAECTVVFP